MMTKAELEEEYEKRIIEYRKILPYLTQEVQDCYRGLKENNSIRIDQDCFVTIKGTGSFVNKALKFEIDNETKKEIPNKYKYENPFIDIQDQIRARIVVYYLTDVERIANSVINTFGNIENNDFNNPNDYEKFGYQGRHIIVNINKNLIPDTINVNLDVIPDFFELQVKTLFQHAWSQAEHDLRYKGNGKLSFDDKRMLSFAAAQAWGADKVFEGIFKRQENCDK